MRGVGSLGIIIRMAIATQFWQCGIITVMTGGTFIGNGYMCSFKIGMRRVGSRFPTRIGSMAVGTLFGYCGGGMVGIYRLIVIIGMATCTGIGCSGIS